VRHRIDSLAEVPDLVRRLNKERVSRD